jgi:hypothetical protein
MRISNQIRRRTGALSVWSLGANMGATRANDFPC